LSARFHGRRLDRTHGDAKPAAETRGGVVFHLFVHKHTSAKEAPLNAITALGARVWVRRCDILRPNHQVLSIRQLHYLKVMAAAGTTTAKSTDLMIRHVQAEMDQPMIVGLLQDIGSVRNGNWPCSAVGDKLVSKVIEHEADI